MSTIHLVPEDLRETYYVKEWRNAAGILATACPDEWADIIAVLRGFKLLKSEVLAKGGGKSPVANRIDREFYARDWMEKKFDTAISVDDQEYASPTHSVDCFKGRVLRRIDDAPHEAVATSRGRRGWWMPCTDLRNPTGIVRRGLLTYSAATGSALL